MEALFRALAAFLVLLLHALGRGVFLPHPIVTAPTATSTVAVATTPAPTSTIVPSYTAAASATPSRSRTPVALETAPPSPTTTTSATPTATARPNQGSASDPTGFDVVGAPPAQKLPAALLIYPLIRTSPTEDTRLELMNLTTAAVSVQCFYVSGPTCNEIGFFVRLTANQPLSWVASTGTSGNGGRIAPPFSGEGELKCVVSPSDPAVTAYNALQGRALLSDTTGQTIGYSAIAFRRLSPGSFTGVVSLDGVTYEQCPDRLHFQVLTSQAGSDSEMVLVPCSEDLENQISSSATIQFAVINELEVQFSAATHLKCFDHRRFSTISPLRRSVAGTDTAHIIVRGTDLPVVGLVIDRFTVPGSTALSTSSNEPYLEGGRSATLTLP
jgi:hypothetical protein